MPLAKAFTSGSMFKRFGKGASGNSEVFDGHEMER